MGKLSRDKGKRAEREIAALMEEQVQLALARARIQRKSTKRIVQRNQNQSAVGGEDLTNTFGFSVEVKHHAKLALPAWWKQTLQQARGKTPVLVFKEDRKAWQAMMWAEVGGIPVAAIVSIQDFLAVFFRSVLEQASQPGFKID